MHSEEMKEKKLGALRSNMDIIISGLGVLVPFEFKDNLADSMVWNTGETGEIYQDKLTDSKVWNTGETGNIFQS